MRNYFREPSNNEDVVVVVDVRPCRSRSNIVIIRFSSMNSFHEGVVVAVVLHGIAPAMNLFSISLLLLAGKRKLFLENLILLLSLRRL